MVIQGLTKSYIFLEEVIQSLQKSYKGYKSHTVVFKKVIQWLKKSFNGKATLADAGSVFFKWMARSECSKYESSTPVSAVETNRDNFQKAEQCGFVRMTVDGPYPLPNLFLLAR
jgi:hypothetical protein